MLSWLATAVFAALIIGFMAVAGVVEPGRPF
jgi:hypothetical protein